MRFDTDNLLAKGLLVLTAVILVVIPFHATITVWLASVFGHYTVWRLWKEALLAIIVVGTIVLLIQNTLLRRKMWQEPFVRPLLVLIGIYVVLHCMAAAVALLKDEVTLKAAGYGLVSNLRFLAFFVACLVLGSYAAPWVKAHWKQLLLWPAALVVGFGLLQVFMLPVDFLKHVGYGPETIKPYIAIDQKDEYARVQSTLRGPNPLGAYLVIIITAASGLLLAGRLRSWKLIVGLIATLIVLYETYSRSAWIGVVFSVATLAWLSVQSVRVRKIVIAVSFGFALIGAGAVFVLRDNDHVQNLLFHTDEHSLSSSSSNESRGGVLIKGVDDVIEQPFGRGPGTAGPASVYNEDSVRISENYFLQIAQEVGIFGCAVFIAICCFAGSALWRVRKTSALPIILIASLVGISVINMVSHAWADDTLAYIWWGFAGLALGSVLLVPSQKGKNRGKKTV